jgi:plasmid stabilization system protein ParE
VDYRLPYTQKALNDLAEIIGRMAEHDAEAASRFGAGLLDHVDLLARFPHMGAPVPKRPKVRKLAHSPILVYYYVHEEKHTIEILRFRHGARQAPGPELWIGPA